MKCQTVQLFVRSLTFVPVNPASCVAPMPGSSIKHCQLKLRYFRLIRHILKDRSGNPSSQKINITELIILIMNLLLTVNSEAGYIGIMSRA